VFFFCIARAKFFSPSGRRKAFIDHSADFFCSVKPCEQLKQRFTVYFRKVFERIPGQQSLQVSFHNLKYTAI
jgi:hypothetical protein